MNNKKNKRIELIGVPTTKTTQGTTFWSIHNVYNVSVNPALTMSSPNSVHVCWMIF